MLAIIPENKHYRRGMFPKIHIGKTYNIKYNVTFNSTAIYELEKNKTQVNKLLGIGLVHHHLNSIRVGWRWVPEKGQIELLAYTYRNKKREYHHLIYVDLYKEFTLNITYSMNKSMVKYKVEMEIPNTAIFTLQEQQEYKLNKWYYRIPFMYQCYPYFGGTEPAPHDISIKIK